MLRLAVGGQSQLCEVADKFKVVVIVEDGDRRRLDLPFLNRFERQMMRPRDVLSHRCEPLLKSLKQWLAQAVKETGLSVHAVFPTLHPDTLPSAVLRALKYNDEPSAEEATAAEVEVKRAMARLATPVAILYSPLLSGVIGGSNAYFETQSTLIELLRTSILPHTDDVSVSSVSETSTSAGSLQVGPGDAQVGEQTAQVQPQQPQKGVGNGSEKISGATSAATSLALSVVMTPCPLAAFSMDLLRGVLEEHNADCRHHRVADFGSERDVAAAFAEFFESTAAGLEKSQGDVALFIMQCDSLAAKADVIRHAMWVCQQEQARAEEKHGPEALRSRRVLFVLHLPPSVRNRVRRFPLSLATGWDYFYCDELTTSSDLHLRELIELDAVALHDRGLFNMTDVLRLRSPLAWSHYAAGPTFPAAYSLVDLSLTSSIPGDSPAASSASHKTKNWQLLRLRQWQDLLQWTEFRQFVSDMVLHLLKRNHADAPSEGDAERNMPKHVRLAAKMATGSLRQTLLSALELTITDALVFLLPILDCDQQLVWLHRAWTAGSSTGPLKQVGPSRAALQVWLTLARSKAVINVELLGARFLPQRKRISHAVMHGQQVQASCAFPFAARVSSLVASTVDAVLSMKTGATNSMLSEMIDAAQSSVLAALGGDAMEALSVCSALIQNADGSPLGFLCDFVNICIPPSNVLTYSDHLRLCAALFQLSGDHTLSNAASVYVLSRWHSQRLSIFEDICALHGSKLIPVEALLEAVEGHSPSGDVAADCRVIDGAVLDLVLRRVAAVIDMLRHDELGISLQRAVSNMLQQTLPALEMLVQLRSCKETHEGAWRTRRCQIRALSRLSVIIEESLERKATHALTDNSLEELMAGLGGDGDAAFSGAVLLARPLCAAATFSTLMEHIVASEGLSLHWSDGALHFSAAFEELWRSGHVAGAMFAPHAPPRRRAVFEILRASLSATMEKLDLQRASLDADHAELQACVLQATATIVASRPLCVSEETSFFTKLRREATPADISVLVESEGSNAGFEHYLASTTRVQNILQDEARRVAALFESASDDAADAFARETAVLEAAPATSNNTTQRAASAKVMPPSWSHVSLFVLKAMARLPAARLYFIECLLHEGGGSLMVALAAAQEEGANWWLPDVYRVLSNFKMSGPPTLDPTRWFKLEKKAYENIYNLLGDALTSNSVKELLPYVTPTADSFAMVLAPLENKIESFVVLLASAWFAIVSLIRCWCYN